MRRVDSSGTRREEEQVQAKTKLRWKCCRKVVSAVRTDLRAEDADIRSLWRRPCRRLEDAVQSAVNKFQMGDIWPYSLAQRESTKRCAARAGRPETNGGAQGEQVREDEKLGEQVHEAFVSVRGEYGMSRGSMRKLERERAPVRKPSEKTWAPEKEEEVEDS